MYVLFVTNPAVAAKSNKPLLLIQHTSTCCIMRTGRQHLASSNPVATLNKWSKNFDERSHHVVPLFKIERSLSLHAVIDD